MKVGFATLDITPPLGSEKPGGLNKAHNRNIHDALRVKAMLIDDGAKRVALVGVDALSLKASIVRNARHIAEELCGIPGHHVMCAATHTHSGGPIAGATATDFEHASDPDFCRHLAVECASTPDPDYVRHVTRQIGSAAALADRNKTDARLAVGVGKESRVSFNRRFRMSDGRQMTHPGKGNPDIVGPAGPIDPDVGVLSAWAPDGRLLGCVVNFACHATTMMGGPVSADWPHYLDLAIRNAMGRDAVVVFLNGPCGDVSQVDNLSMRESETGEKWARRVGQTVAGEALKVLAQAEPARLEPVDSATENIRIATRTLAPDRVQAALELLKRDAPQDHTWCYARDTVLLNEMNKVEPTVPCEIQAIQVGPVVLVGNPAEYFCQFGLDIKAASPFPFTFVVELANGCVGYVPTAEAMGESGGGYETHTALSSKLVPEAGRVIADASIKVIRSLSVGRLPEPPQATAGSPWVMGSAGPEEI